MRRLQAYFVTAEGHEGIYVYSPTEGEIKGRIESELPGNLTITRLEWADEYIPRNIPVVELMLRGMPPYASTHVLLPPGFDL